MDTAAAAALASVTRLLRGGRCDQSHEGTSSKLTDGWTDGRTDRWNGMPTDGDTTTLVWCE